MTDLRPGGFQQLPFVVKNIIIINVLMVVLQYVLAVRGIDLQDTLGLHYWASPLFKWWQPVTHLFMHGSPYDPNLTFWHLLSNMFALWMFGRILENIWGPRRFLIFYFICGLGAALCHLLVLAYQFSPILHEIDRIKNMPGASQLVSTYYAYVNQATVGASGAVFGVLFAFGYLFPNTEMMIIPIPIPIKAKWLVGFYALFELYAGIKNSAGDDVAHFAHLGGMLFAFIILRIWKNRVRTNFY